MNADFRRELALCISKMKDPRISMLEVVRVKVTPDLNYAKVYIASLSGGEAAAEACHVLRRIPENGACPHHEGPEDPGAGIHSGRFCGLLQSDRQYFEGVIS